MSLSPEFPRLDETFAKPETLLRVPVGFASPLWALFAGAAVSGSAWWWMSRWSRPENLEALFGAATAASETAAALAPEPAPLAEAPTIAAPEPAAPALEAVADAVALVEDIMEPPATETPPMGGEAAPIAPAIAAEAAEPEAAPKPRVRRSEPKPE